MSTNEIELSEPAARSLADPAADHDSAAKRRTQPSKVDQYCRWICERLRRRGSVDKSAFVSHFGVERGPTDASLSTDWNRIHHAIEIALKAAEVPVARDADKLYLKGPFERTRYETSHFSPFNDSRKKEGMGELVARYLKELSDTGQRLSVFLGSGSTIFHVGLKMGEIAQKRGQYEQLFWTVNIALAAAWCELKRPPVDKISIPEAVLETKTFRFATMQKPAWCAAIVVVGADGCLHDGETGNVVLYANEVSVANNTNVFVSSATHSIICCLASSKMRHKANEGQNAGPPINIPKRAHLRRFLVTDQSPDESIRSTLEKDDWVIVTEYEDWTDLPLSSRK